MPNRTKEMEPMSVSTAGRLWYVAGYFIWMFSGVMAFAGIMSALSHC